MASTAARLPPPSSVPSGPPRRSPARLASSSARRLFPIPGSPPMSTRRPRPESGVVERVQKARRARAPDRRRHRPPGASRRGPMPSSAALLSASAAKSRATGSCRRIACSRSWSARLGLETELLHERAPRLLVGLQRFRLPTRAVQREHQLPARPLAQRVSGDERLELGDEISLAPEREVGVDPFLDGGQAQLLEAGDLLLRERVEGEVGKRRAAPELQRLAEQHRGVVRCAFAAGRPRPWASSAAKRSASSCPASSRKHIARRPGHEDAATAVVREHLAKPRDVPLHDLRRGRRRPLAPELVDQSIGRDDLVRVQKEHGQKRTLPAAPISSTRPCRTTSRGPRTRTRSTLGAAKK